MVRAFTLLVVDGGLLAKVERQAGKIDPQTRCNAPGQRAAD
jgi:hypothetical protein